MADNTAPQPEGLTTSRCFPLGTAPPPDPGVPLLWDSSSSPNRRNICSAMCEACKKPVKAKRASTFASSIQPRTPRPHGSRALQKELAFPARCLRLGLHLERLQERLNRSHSYQGVVQTRASAPVYVRTYVRMYDPTRQKVPSAGIFVQPFLTLSKTPPRQQPAEPRPADDGTHFRFRLVPEQPTASTPPRMTRASTSRRLRAPRAKPHPRASRSASSVTPARHQPHASVRAAAPLNPLRFRKHLPRQIGTKAPRNASLGGATACQGSSS